MLKVTDSFIEVLYVLGDEKHFFEVYFNNEKIVEVSKHYLALEFVKELSFIESDIVLNVYDETYAASYSILNGDVVGELQLPDYLAEYKDRYFETLNGNFKNDLITSEYISI